MQKNARAKRQETCRRVSTTSPSVPCTRSCELVVLSHKHLGFMGKKDDEERREGMKECEVILLGAGSFGHGTDSLLPGPLRLSTAAGCPESDARSRADRL